MSSTNQTPNLDLSQFIAPDKPAWLVDYNRDMSKIDTGYGTVKAQADATDTAVTGVSNRVGVVETTLTDTINPAISALQTDDTAHGNAINTIQSLIGNGTPTTTDQTIIGAINEINGRRATLYSHTFASGTSYATMYATIYASIGTVLDALDNLDVARLKMNVRGSLYTISQHTAGNYTFERFFKVGTAFNFDEVAVGTTGSANRLNITGSGTVTITDRSNETVTADTLVEIYLP